MSVNLFPLSISYQSNVGYIRQNKWHSSCFHHYIHRLTLQNEQFRNLQDNARIAYPS